jgi:hypothetical protein
MFVVYNFDVASKSRGSVESSRANASKQPKRKEIENSQLVQAALRTGLISVMMMLLEINHS